MDGNNFDSLTKRLGGLVSRRQTIGGLVGAAFAAAGLSAEAAKNKKKARLARLIPKGKGIGKSACGNQGCFVCSGGGTPVNGQCPPGEVGICVTGTGYTFCGSGGGSCEDCSATAGETCIANSTGDGGACAVPSPQCNVAQQCNVLVNGNVTCRSFQGPGACGDFLDPGGTGTFICAPPCPAGQSCIDNGGGVVCTTAQCTTVCPDGCCIGPDDPLGRPLGSCQSGGDILACGEGGSTCVSCLAVCGLDGNCVNGVCDCLIPPPGPPTCPEGLADCAGVCVDFATNESNCGGCGIACGDNQRCKGGTCKRRRRRR